MNKPILKAKVKKTNQVIDVYKLADGRYNRFLGEDISIESVSRQEHTETFDKAELEFLKS